MLQWPGQLQTATVLFDATLRIPGGLFEGPRGDEGTCTIYLLQSAEILTPDAGSDS